MKINLNKIYALQKETMFLIDHVNCKEKEYQHYIAKASLTYEKSIKNLTHYLALRSHNINKFQKQLGYLGLSRLARSEAHVLSSLRTNLSLLNSLAGEKDIAPKKDVLSIKKGEKLLNTHTKNLLGYRSKGRRVRIMVTMPSEAATNYELVKGLVEAGMNCARINCAHDSRKEWLQMIENIKTASSRQKRKVKIAMDLSGPKIRTGNIKAGRSIRKFTPKKNELGQVINPSEIRFIPDTGSDLLKNEVPVDQVWLSKLTRGDKVNFIDIRGKQRSFTVNWIGDKMAVAHCYESAHINSDTIFSGARENLGFAQVGTLPPLERCLLLKSGDLVTLHSDDIVGQRALFDESGHVIRQAHIGCTLPNLWKMVRVGEKVFFNDGKIEGIIRRVCKNKVEIEIIRANKKGSKLKSDKGINLPDSNLTVSGLTQKDKEDLVFVAKYADIVNYSFVNSQEDVKELLSELKDLEVIGKLSIILKIETQRGYNNLANILLEAMQTSYIGIMIARGDLAIEVGWDKIGWVQDEIIAMCNAAHVPVVWATQVLENLAKKGMPSRSEITDATQSLKTECVMLNKGPHILRTIRLLNQILSKSENYRVKNEKMMPEMERL